MAGHNNIDARLRSFNFMPVAVPCERTIQPNALALRHRTTQQIDKHLCAYTWDFYSDFIARIPICFSSEYKRTKWISTYREFNMYFSCMFNNWSNRSRWQANWKQKLLVFDRHTKFLDTILVAVIIRVHECCCSWRCKTENIDWIRTESVFDIHVWWTFSLEWIVTFAYVSFSSKLQQCRLTLSAQPATVEIVSSLYECLCCLGGSSSAQHEQIHSLSALGARPWRIISIFHIQTTDPVMHAYIYWNEAYWSWHGRIYMRKLKYTLSL